MIKTTNCIELMSSYHFAVRCLKLSEVLRKTINVINNTLPTYMNAPDKNHIGFYYNMNKFTINELYSEVFPSSYYYKPNSVYKWNCCVDYLHNKYSLADRGFTQILINKDQQFPLRL